MHKVLQSLQLSLLNVGYAHLDKHWNYDNVVSPFTRMYYISKGSAKVYHNDQTFDLKPGYMYLIPSFTYSRYKCDEYHEQYYISFFEEIKNGLSIFNLKSFVYELKAKDTDIAYFKRLLEINPNRALVNDDPEVYDNRPTLQTFKKKNEKLSSAFYLETNGLLRILLSKFIKDHNRLVIKNTTRNNLSQVLSHISENLDKELTINELASYCHLSTDYFSRIFKQKFGMRPNKYIQSKRVERAQLLLLTTDNSLKQIAEKVGLENLSYFSRVFKSFTGKTPGNFRKEELNV
ncbi:MULTISPECIES: helix-turn-helix domain-containing protein [Aquimarina]|uniref:Helix-turn-helix domain-containing protein n=1 Tax=Aquimarina algiphila TaxID=2047982 RepID=A0A554VQJ0_9FLAO|nr:MULTISPECIES: AraC family transcriptional regulator [Aquimarina]TSE10807.1 helix-turn-helix domain-containing protein [Aquimarina algiphila]